MVNALALAAAAGLMPGITVTGATGGDKVVKLVLVALVFGVVNAVVSPVVMLLSIPFIILTLGLLIFVINAVMLLLTSWLSGQLGLGFHVDGLLTAILGAVIVAVSTWILERLLPSR